MVAREIIEAARDFAITGSELMVTDRMMLRALARAERIIYGLVTPLNEDALADLAEFTKPEIDASLESTDSPLFLPEFYSVIDATVTYDGIKPECPLFLVPVKMKGEMPEYYPSAFLIGRGIHLIRRNPHAKHSDEWVDAESVVVRYLPRPEAPARLSDELTLPDYAEDYLVLALADFMLTAMGDRVPSVTEQHVIARDSLVATLVNLDATTTWKVRDLG